MRLHARNLHKQCSINHLEIMDNGLGPPESQWSDDDMDHPPMKRMRSDGSSNPSYGDTHTVMTTDDYDDPCPCTQQHLDAADIRNPDILALTPPQGDNDLALNCVDVDVRGPGKFECDCPPEWNGLRCEIYDATFGGGIPAENPFQKFLEEERKLCVINRCEDKEKNNICDEECK